MEIDSQAGSYEALAENFRWQVPERFNIAVDVCGRWAEDRSRFALYYEDESGFTSAHTFWDIQRAANRLANVLAALGTLAGDASRSSCRNARKRRLRMSPSIRWARWRYRCRICLGRMRWNTGSATRARTSPSSMRQFAAEVAGAARPPAATAARDRCRRGAGKGVKAWAEVLEHASPRYTPLLTAADDPAMILYTSGTTGKPKGALMAHRTLLGNLSGYVCSHDFFPAAAGDLFWSPADWAWTGGLWDVLCCRPGTSACPCSPTRDRFDAGKAFALIEKYGIAQQLPLSNGAEDDDEGRCQSRAPDLRSRPAHIMSAGEPVAAKRFFTGPGKSWG
jgi:acetyl-CoA synthetase